MHLPNPSGEVELSPVQWKRRLAIAFLIAIAAVSAPFVCAIWLHTNPLFYAQVEHAGIFLIVIAIAGRTWSAMHIGGHKKVLLIESGPYSIVRNPLYVFSLIGAAGIGAQTSSLTVAAVGTIATAVVLSLVVSKEEAYLREKFGDAFVRYTKRVPRFVPRIGIYRDVEQLTISTKIVYRTFLESSLFLLAIPVIDAIELARSLGWVPDLLHLP